MVCCNNDLGSFPHNKTINTGINATQGGVYVAILIFGGMRLRREFSVDLGSLIKIPVPFNEDYLYSLQIEKPDGTLHSLNSCTNFSFKTYIALKDCGDPCFEEEIIIYQ